MVASAPLDMLGAGFDIVIFVGFRSYGNTADRFAPRLTSHKNALPYEVCEAKSDFSAVLR
jgi:hypothetical protein